MRSIFKLILTVVALTQISAHADFMFEAYIGAETTKQSGKSIALLDAEGTAAGSTLGLRIGSDHKLMWIGLDYSRLTGGKLEFENPAILATWNELDFDREVFGLTLGFNFPALLRVWAGYGFLDSMATKSLANGDNTFKGTNTKVGIGFTGLPFVSVNVEYIVRTYTSWTGDNQDSGNEFNETWADFNHATTLVSLSLPL